jgi:sugar phosphate isomerase/epimerase
MSNLGFHCNRLELFEEMVLGNGLKRAELYNLHSDDLPQLRKLIDKHKLAWSIHAPLIQLDWYPRPPTWSFLCDEDSDNRELTMKMIRLTVNHAEEFGAEYIVVHFPSPAAHTPTENLGQKIRAIAWKSCDRLAELSLKRGVTIHAEGVGATPLINAEFLTSVLKEYSPPLKYCFDTAHSYLAAQSNSFDLYEFERALLPYLGSVHLWNIRGKEDYDAYRHIPVHPSQRAEEGWADIARILKILGDRAKSLPVIFESDRIYPEALGKYDYREGVKWVKELLAT